MSKGYYTMKLGAKKHCYLSQESPFPHQQGVSLFQCQINYFHAFTEKDHKNHQQRIARLF